MAARNLRNLAVEGITWQVIVGAVNRLISFCATLFLARMLGPSVFGLFALTLSVVNSFELFKSMGLDTALIRRNDEFDAAADTAFVIIPVLGLSLYAAMSASAPYLASVFRSPELSSTMRVIGIAFLCNCFSRVPSAIMEKRMEFKRLSQVEAVTNTIFPVAAVLFTLAGMGIWSLVIAYVMKMAMYMVLIWRKAGWRPGLRFSPRIAWEMFTFGKFVFLSSVVYFLRMNLDNILVGKYLGVTMLGFYALAFNIANFASDHFGYQVHRVVYSAYSRIEGDDAFRAAFLKTLKGLAMIALPYGACIMLLGDDLLRVAYGSKWLAAGPVLKILALAGIFNTLPAGMMPVFLSKGKSVFSFLIPGVQVAIFAVLVTPAALSKGVTGVAAVVLFASALGMSIALYCVCSLLKVSIAQFRKSLMPAFASSLAMTGVIAGLKSLVLPYHQSIGVPASFSLLAAAAVVSYFLVLMFFERDLFRKLRRVTA